MKKSSETVGQAWIRALSLVAIDKDNAVAFDDAMRAVPAVNPMLGMDGKALHFAAQGWLVATQSSSATV
jgi:hypothetical protein